jgi:hypothetical protein
LSRRGGGAGIGWGRRFGRVHGARIAPK